MQGLALIVTAAVFFLRKRTKQRRNSMAFAGLDIFSADHATNEKLGGGGVGSPSNGSTGNLAGDPAIMGAAAGGGSAAAGSKAARRASGANGEGGLWAGAAGAVAGVAAGAGGRRRSSRGGNDVLAEEGDEGAFGGGRIDPCEYSARSLQDNPFRP